MPGIIDTLVGAEVILSSEIPHRNRLAVILIDSAFETACRAFLRHKKRVKLDENHKHRHSLVSTVKSKLPHIDSEVWDNIDFYYEEIRNDFYHQSAGKTITDVSLLDYKETVEFVVGEAFDIQVGPLVAAKLIEVQRQADAHKTELIDSKVPLLSVQNRIDKVVVAVGVVQPRNAAELNDFFKREGDPLRLQPEEFTNIVARNSGSKNYFYHDKELQKWTLSSAGRFKLSQIQGV